MVVVSLDAIGNLINTEVGTRNSCIAVIKLTMCLFGEIWNFVLWIRKAVECFKHCLMGHTSRSIEGTGTKTYLNYGVGKSSLKRFQRKNFSMFPRNYSCDVLGRKWLQFAFVQRVCLRLKQRILD